MKLRFLMLSAIWVLVSMPAGSPVTVSAQDPSPVCADTQEAELLKLINTYRLANGQQPFTFSQSLSVAADVHSRDMATNNFVGHTGTNGSTFSQRIADAGYAEPATSGENVFAGDPAAAGAFGWWQNSPGHNASMLSPALRGHRYCPGQQSRFGIQMVLDDHLRPGARFLGLRGDCPGRCSA